MSQITTHVLDTQSGKPASGVNISLFEINPDLKEIASGVTNEDGRIHDLLDEKRTLNNGVYKMRFEIASYFEKQGTQTFYPFVEITFKIEDNVHYHIPLLLSPFGYTTYRGS